ncbi:unnamed protein product [Brassica rapa]|uniref:Uncharacterized protein n=1 Tax=Brassica campestris TaxID=3711 RepID=A0A8D9G286_BRACM|nr:unnamed protein product [Brassica rapa]
MVYVTQERCYWGRVFSRVELCLLFFRNAVPREAAMVQEAEDHAHCLWNYGGTPNMDKSKLDTRVLQRTVMQLHHQVIYRFCKLFADIFESSTDIAVHNGIYKKEL